jgi:enoyl-[acyl-carrier-protein] reductase (NADH)
VGNSVPRQPLEVPAHRRAGGLGVAGLDRGDECGELFARGGAYVAVAARDRARQGRRAGETGQEEVWERVFAVNVTGVYNACRAALPAMIERGRGSIVNVASVAGLVGLPQRAAYCASKGAVISLTRAMAIDHVADGVRVNCVCPGTVDTPWVARLLDASGDAAAARERLAARQPLGRLGTPQEIAEAIGYLADAEFATGTALVVDAYRGLGGLRARWASRIARPRSAYSRARCL